MSIFGKAHSALSGKSAPFLGDRGSRPGAPWETGPGGAQRPRGAALHGQAYGGGRDGVDYFYEVANIFATAATTADWHLRDDDKRLVLELPEGEKPPNVEKITGDLRTLFTVPNPWMTWRELLELYVIDLLAVGDAVWLKQGAMPDGSQALALYRIPPQNMEAIPGKEALIDHYIFTQGRKRMKVQPQFVVHTRLPNPHSENSMLGLGVVQAAPQVFDVELGLLEAQRNFFENGTVLSGTMESDKSIPEATRKKSLREFRQLQKGSRNWFNVAFLERGMRYRPIQANAQQADYRNLSLMSRERVFGLLRTPLILSGVATSDTAGMKMDEARRFWSEEVGQPFLSRLADAFSLSLVGDRDLTFKFDYGYKIPEADKIDLALAYADLPGITVGEVRTKAGLPPLPADLVDPQTGEPVSELVLNLPGPSTEGPDGSPDNLDGRDQGGRPADRENVPAVPAGRQAKRDDEGANQTRSRRQRAGTASMRPVRRGGKALLFSPEELASGRVLEQLRGH